MADFTMPALGADMETGRVAEWLVAPGARVKPGDVVVVVETHKGAIDVECFLDGVIDDLAPVGEDLAVGAVLARVRGVGEDAAPATPAPAAAATAAPPPAAVREPVAVTASGAPPRIKLSPAARRRALELGLDVQRLQSRGGDGVLTLADVESAASGPRPRAAARRGFDPAQMRRAIAAAMARSKREIPHYYLTSTIDFATASAWLAAYNDAREPAERLLPATLLLKAAAKALTVVPQFNGFHENGTYRAGAGVHVGWAIALRGGGLVAPAIHDADRKSLPGLMMALRDLVQRARAGGLRSSELTDPTITVTSLGERGAESVLGVIYPPQVAIVGFGHIVERPWAVDGQIVVRPLVSATQAADHRASDGHLGGQLLAAIDRALQTPEDL
jgi:pyruvate dehydrogenase E2 component (dihydrolipoamide acetyltransferase)